MRAASSCPQHYRPRLLPAIPKIAGRRTCPPSCTETPETAPPSEGPVTSVAALPPCGLKRLPLSALTGAVPRTGSGQSAVPESRRALPGPVADDGGRGECDRDQQGPGSRPVRRTHGAGGCRDTVPDGLHAFLRHDGPASVRRLVLPGPSGTRPARQEVQAAGVRRASNAPADALSRLVELSRLTPERRKRPAAPIVTERNAP